MVGKQVSYHPAMPVLFKCIYIVYSNKFSLQQNTVNDFLLGLKVPQAFLNWQILYISGYILCKLDFVKYLMVENIDSEYEMGYQQSLSFTSILSFKFSLTLEQRTSTSTSFLYFSSPINSC